MRSNHILRHHRPAGALHDHVIIDNEAGMEHLSRRTTRDVDALFVARTRRCARNWRGRTIRRACDEMDINIKNVYLIINQGRGELTPALQAAVDQAGIPLGGIIPADPQVTQLDADGVPLVNLPPDSVISGHGQQTVPARQPG